MPEPNDEHKSSYPEDFQEFVKAREAEESGEAKEETSGAPVEGEPESAEESEPSEDTEEQEEAVEEKPGKREAKPKGAAAQDRINKLTREKRELEERLREAKAGQKPAADEKPKAEEKAVEPPPKPIQTDFDDYSDWVEALTDWKADRKAEQLEAKRTAVEADKMAAGQQHEVFQAYKERADAFMKDHADFVEAIEASEVKFPKVFTDAILDSEQGPALSYAFAKDPEMAERIAEMAWDNPVRAIRELGKLEASLDTKPKAEAKPAPEVKKATKAPVPIRKPTATGAGVNVDPGDPSRWTEENYREWEAARNKQLKRK